MRSSLVPNSASSSVQKKATAPVVAATPIVKQAPSIQRKSCSCGGGCPRCAESTPQLKSNLPVSQPSDHAEQQADQIADQVMQSSSQLGAINQSQSASVQRKSANTKTETSKSTDAAVPQQQGQPLNETTRSFMEPRFGEDFSNVRVHTDSSAQQSARALDAKAYTVGNDIVFGNGEYKPESESGKHLLAHELAHVVQSNDSTINRQMIYRQPTGDAGDLAAIEAEIEQWSMYVGFGGPAAGAAMMKIAELERRRNALLSRGVGAPAATTKPKEKTKPKPVEPAPTGPYPVATDWSGGDMTQLELDRMHQDLDAFKKMAQPSFGGDAQPEPAPQSGCHPDPYATKTKSSGICGGGHHKQTDPAVLATQKAMEMPAPDFSAQKAEERAMLDRLNAAHLTWKSTGKFTPSTEFSPYEIEKDRIIELYKRWDLFEKSDPEKDAVKNPIEYYFRSRNEYIQEQERRITRRPFKDRLYSARQKARARRDDWYDANTANEKMTGEDIWSAGINADLFIASEKARVYKEQGALQELEREEREERQAQDRRNFEIEKARRWEAQGDALRSPTGVLQPFAMAALGPWVAAAYGGIQGGKMVGDAVNECKDGVDGDCVASLIPIAATVVVHQATKPTKPTSPNVANTGPAALENEVGTMPRKLDLSKNFQESPTVVIKPPKPQDPVVSPTVKAQDPVVPPAVKAQDPVVTPPVVKSQDPVVPPPSKVTQPPKPAENVTPPKSDTTPVEKPPVIPPKTDPVPAPVVPKEAPKPQTQAELQKLGIKSEPGKTYNVADFSKVKLKDGQQALYILRDADGTILKVGRTSEGGSVSRLGVYKKAGATEIEIYPLEGNITEKMANSLEAALRKKLTGEGHAMPWDNTGGRLGRSGFGTPGEGVRTPPISKDRLIELLKQHKGNRKEVGEALAKELGRDSVHPRTVGMWAQAYGIDTKIYK